MDVVDLREFYGSRLGQTARRLINHRIRTRWKDLKGATVLGLGYATPYLDPWRDEADRVLAFMPARQGVVHWPARAPNLTALVDEACLPIEDASVNLSLVVHGLELTDQLPAMLQELWRVTAAQGRILLVVPNRRGMWARFDTTPFGHGRPFSRSQITALLRDAQFSPAGWSTALYVPPFDRSFLIRSAPAWERIGLTLTQVFCGVLIVEAVKQVYSTTAVKRSRRAVPVLNPQAAGAAAMEPHGRLVHEP